MQVEVKEALRALTNEDTQMTAHQVLGLQDRLRIVDEKFSQLRSEITRLNSMLLEEREKNTLLKDVVTSLTTENEELKTISAQKSDSNPSSKSPNKKKTTNKKKK